MNGVTLSYCYSGDYPTRGKRGRVLKESLDVWTCLGVNPLDMDRTPYWASERKHSQPPTMPHHHTLTASPVHHSFHQRTALFLSY